MRSIRHLLVTASATAALFASSLLAAPALTSPAPAKSGAGAAPCPAVATLRSAEWSPGDTTREGASEFEVLICAAKLQQTKAPAGIVGTGNRHGLFLTGAERALHDLSLRGVSIAKLPRGGDLAADPEGIFLDASGLTEAQATAILMHCLELHGAPPAVADCAHPTASELSAIRAHLRPFREAFDVARSPRVASK